MGFLRTLLILMLLYYGFRLIVRTVLPYFAKRWVKKAQDNFQQQQGFTDPEEAKRHEGEVKFTSQNTDSKSSAKKKDELGDYIEFEEVTDDK